MQKTYLEGLNTLRFCAAVLVVLGHCQQQLVYFDIHTFSDCIFLYKAGTGVEFFFILSGFLLTYLSLQAFAKSGTFAIKAFFVRRILRIFPLYYWSVLLGFLIFGFVLPVFLQKSYMGFDIMQGLPYFLFLLPNCAIHLYPKMNAVLTVLWSIGVEEQFYLFFPFLMLFVQQQKNVLAWLFAFFGLYFLIFNAIQQDFGLQIPIFIQKILLTLKFHFMLIGCCFAAFSWQYAAFLDKILQYKMLQALIYALALGFIFLNTQPEVFSFFQNIVFGFLILTVAFAKNKLFDLEKQPFTYFGIISYGIYIYHLYLCFLLQFCLKKYAFLMHLVQYFPAAYFLIAISTTLIVAHFSYQYFELYFIEKKDKIV
jgi:peptidoglycan/LPS O-acetylase OafA/YrhL